MQQYASCARHGFAVENKPVTLHQDASRVIPKPHPVVPPRKTRSAGRDQTKRVVSNLERLAIVHAPAANAVDETVVTDHHAAVSTGVEIEPDATVRHRVLVKLCPLQKRPAQRNAVGDIPNLVVMHEHAEPSIRRSGAAVTDHDASAVRPIRPGAWPHDEVLDDAAADLDDRVAVARQFRVVGHAGDHANREHLTPRRAAALRPEATHMNPFDQCLPD